MISGLPLFLHSRLATVDESPASDSKQAERIEGAHSVMIEVIPFTREEKWSFARVRQGMDQMDKCEAVCFRARQNPCAVRSKDFLNLAGKLKGGP